MIYHRSLGVYYLHLVLQLFAVGLVGLALAYLFGALGGRGVSEEQWSQYLAYGLSAAVGMVLSGVGNQELVLALFRQGFPAAHLRAIRQTGFAAVMVSLMILSNGRLGVPAAVFPVFFASAYLVCLLTNRYLPHRLASWVYCGAATERTLLLGTARRANAMAGWLRAKEPFGVQVVGLVTMEMPEAEQTAFRILGGLDDLERVITAERISQVVMVEFPYVAHVLGNVAALCERLAVRLLVVTDFEEKIHHPVRFLSDEGWHFMTLRREPLENPVNRFIKRSLDIALALPVCVFVLPPLALVIFILQRRFSPGPVIYRQERAGLQNRPFTMLKFRTMHVGDHPASRQATADDDRIYPGAKWLRRTSLDELPQFLNVLRGEMSVVGPRPHLPEHNAEFAAVMQNYHIRSLVKPGMTGLAQVRGFRGEVKSASDVRLRIDSDLHYIDSWSFGMDVMIIVRTAWQLFFPPKSAY